MPQQTYKVTLSDGRSFNVTTDGGPPEEQDVLDNLDKFIGKSSQEIKPEESPSGPQMNFAIVNGQRVPINAEEKEQQREEKPESTLGKISSAFLEAPNFIRRPAARFNDWMSTPNPNAADTQAVQIGHTSYPASDFTLGLSRSALGGFIGGSTEAAADLLSPSNMINYFSGFGPESRALGYASKGMSALQAGEGVRNIKEGDYLHGIGNLAIGALGLLPSSEKMPVKLKKLGDEKIKEKSEEAIDKSTLAADEVNNNLKSRLRANITRADELLKPNFKGAIPEFEGSNPPLDIQNSTTSPESITDRIIPRPGQARSRDIGVGRATFGSVDQTLRSRPETAPIADRIIKANDEKLQFIATTERELADLTKGLNKLQRSQLGNILDGQEVPGATPDLIQRAEKARQILDSVHEQAGANNEGLKIGYLESYLTHIFKQPDDIRSAVQNIIDYHLGNNSPLKDFFVGKPLGTEGKGDLGDLFERGKGNPSSPFIKERTDQLRNIEYDVNKIFPAYVESMAKVIFDKPAVAETKAMLKKVPDSRLKELAGEYIKNYSRYDSNPQLNDAWNRMANTLGSTTARSLLFLNPGLQALHLGRIPANLWPEIGTKYGAVGFKELISHPTTFWQEAAKLGLLQNQIRPWRFQTTGDKIDSIGNYFSLIDSIDKMAGYYGMRQKLLDSGLSEAKANAQALDFAKQASLTVDMARPIPAATYGKGFPGAATRLGMQFKSIPIKIVEQYASIANAAAKDPKSMDRWIKIAEMLAGAGTAAGAAEVTNEKFFHLSPGQLLQMQAFGAAGSMVKEILQSLQRDGVEGATMKTAQWLTPGGKTVFKPIFQGSSDNSIKALKPLKEVKIAQH